MDLAFLIVGAVVLSLTHICAYKFGKYQGWIDMFRECTQDKKQAMAYTEDPNSPRVLPGVMHLAERV